MNLVPDMHVKEATFASRPQIYEGRTKDFSIRSRFSFNVQDLVANKSPRQPTGSFTMDLLLNRWANFFRWCPKRAESASKLASRF